MLRRFTYIIQLWHDSSASSDLKFKEVDQFFRMTQRFKNIHDVKCVIVPLQLL